MKLLKLLLAAVLSATASAQSAPHTYDPTPRLGVLVPVGPPDYAVLLDALKSPHLIQDGPFTYRTGLISGVPVVLIIQPTDGDLARALGAQEMIRSFNLRALIYPGTSGAHLAKGEMGIGDIVLGAKNVNISSYHLSATGEIQAGTFNAMQPTIRHYGPLYADPKLLTMLACSAHHVAETTTLPSAYEPPAKNAHPQVFYYGIQGTSTIWSDNAEYTARTRQIFHEIDEDGDWDSALVATLWHIPFIEVSVISNSMYAFPGQHHGTPAPTEGVLNSHIYAQRLTNHVALDLIGRYGKQILAGTYTTPTEDPFPAGVFETPLNPQKLLSTCE